MIEYHLIDWTIDELHVPLYYIRRRRHRPLNIDRLPIDKTGHFDGLFL